MLESSYVEFEGFFVWKKHPFLNQTREVWKENLTFDQLSCSTNSLFYKNFG